MNLALRLACVRARALPATLEGTNEGTSLSLLARSLWARGVVLTLAFALLGPALVQAHPIVLESSPRHDAIMDRPPEQVALRFNSAIETRLTQVTIAGRDGHLIPLAVAPNHRNGPPNRLVVPLPPLSTGTYVIRYKILATDGHITEGALRFTVNGVK